MGSDHKSKRLVLHIGTEKTGTTSIQNVLAVNRKRLRENGVIFPTSLGPVNHTLLVAACLDDGVFDNIKSHHIARTGCNEQNLRNRIEASLREELSEGKSWHTLIVSTELIHSRLTQPSEIERLRNLLSPFVDEVKIVLFLRRQDEQALSRYSSVLRAGHSGFDDVFEDLGAHFYLRSPLGRNISDFEQYYDYKRLVERFSGFVSLNEIIVRSYHDHQAGNGVVREFLEISDIINLELENCNTHLNRPISASGQFIMSAVNGIAKPWHRNGLRNHSYKELQKVIERDSAGEPRQVRCADAQRFFERFTESNEWVRKNFFPEKETLFPINFSKYPETVDYTNFGSELSAKISYYKKAVSRLPLSRMKYKVVNGSIRAVKKVRNSFNYVIVRVRCKMRHHFRCWFRLSPLSRDEPKPEYQFALARILGSDHFPRHSSSQALTNLLFTLDHEPDFPDCKKFFVVNRIFDKNAEKAILSLLDSRNIPYVHIPFDPQEYATTDWDTEPFGGDEYFSSREFEALKANLRERDRCFAAAPKVRYAMNVNGARNAALERGACFAEWVLALDGNCILTESCFEKLRKSASRYPHVPYLILPMRRLIDNGEFLHYRETRPGKEEPQIAIHRSAMEKYDERLPYGFRDKAELFIRLGIPGPWLHWTRPFWHPERMEEVSERGLYKFTDATVLRLSSGMNKLDAKKSDTIRYNARSTAILKSLRYLDRKFSCTNHEAERKIFGTLSNDLKSHS